MFKVQNIEGIEPRGDPLVQRFSQLRDDVMKGGQIPEMPVDLLGCPFVQVPLLVPAPLAVFFKP